MKEKTKIWSRFFIIVITVLVVHPGFFAFAAKNQAAQNSTVQNLVQNPLLIFSANSPTAISVTVNSDNGVLLTPSQSCALNNTFSAINSGANLQPASGLLQQDPEDLASNPAVPQNSLRLNPNLNSNCSEIVLGSAITQNFLSVTNFKTWTKILVQTNSQKLQIQSFAASNRSAHSDPILSMNSRFDLAPKQILSAGSPAQNNAFAVNIKPPQKTISQAMLAVWRC